MGHPVLEWRFRAESPWLLVLVALPWLVVLPLLWRALRYFDEGGAVFLLPAALFAFIGGAAWRLWFASWRRTCGGWEYIRLDEDALSWAIDGHGLGRVEYAWLTVVGGVRCCHGVYLQYVPPGHTALLPQTVCLDVRRIRQAGWMGASAIERAIRKRCPPGNLYRV